MPTIWRVYSGVDGQSHLARVALPMTPFVDVEGLQGEAAPAQPATGLTSVSYTHLTLPTIYSV